MTRTAPQPARPIAVRLVAVLIAATGLLSTGCKQEAPAHNKTPIASFGRTGGGPGEFRYPRAAEFGPDGLFYLVDKAGRFQCLKQDGEFVCDWHMPEVSAGRPTGFGIAPDGTLYVADTHYNRVMHFDADGTQLGTFGQRGTEPGSFYLATDVAVDSRGFIYVGEYGGNDRISKFSPEHEFLFVFGGEGSLEPALRRPQGLCVAPDDTLWVADACNHRICHFDGDGRLLSSFGRPGDAVGELWFPYGIDLLSDGTLVIVEYGNNRVQRFSPGGDSLGTWGSAGRDPGQLAYPWALAVGENDQILILDSGNNRVQVIAADAFAKP